MIRTLSAVAILALGTTYALAQATGAKAIEERKALMKDANNLTKQASAMAKGTEPFDAAKAAAWLKGVTTDIQKSLALFPADSKEGAETRAAPAIWTNRADFTAKGDAFQAAVKAAKVTDEASFKASFKQVDDSCNACHKDYRVRR